MTIELQFEGEIAHLVLNRPDKLNALNRQMLGELDSALGELERSSARGVIFSGSGGRAFCAGADIDELIDRPLLQVREETMFGQAVMTRVANLQMPTVAAIDGYAFGGGLELALACWFRIGTTKSRVGLPEIKLGLIPGYGGTQRLPRLVGRRLALEMIASGRTVSSEEALGIGLVDRVVEADAQAASRSFLEGLLCHSLPALNMARLAVLEGMELTAEQGLRLEEQCSTALYQLEDSREGMQAFLEKRKPSFRDA
ncbi:MAG: enoyl-CoA hydratase/isomerase family protein [Gammaproteobacteria bacterium]|nr:enoyl-CoA hydratase/isomerase family protein [Gammaproteobacteria bacterium]